MKRAVIKSTLAMPKGVSSRESVASQRFFEAQSALKISNFWGAEDYIEASDWIELYDIIATDYNWTSTNKIARLGGYLRKHALAWYMQVVKLYPVDQATWPSYKEMFKKRFISAASERTSSSRSEVSSAASER